MKRRPIKHIHKSRICRHAVSRQSTVVLLRSPTSSATLSHEIAGRRYRLFQYLLSSFVCLMPLSEGISFNMRLCLCTYRAALRKHMYDVECCAFKVAYGWWLHVYIRLSCSNWSCDFTAVHALRYFAYLHVASQSPADVERHCSIYIYIYTYIYIYIYTLHTVSPGMARSSALLVLAVCPAAFHVDMRCLEQNKISTVGLSLASLQHHLLRICTHTRVHGRLFDRHWF